MSDEINVVPSRSRFDQLRELYSSFRTSKNFKLIVTTILVLAVPLTVVLSMQVSDLRQRASGPATPATPPGPITQKHPISFLTPQVSLKADDFFIMADGKRYNAQVVGIQVQSDPGSSTYTTLELIWSENGTEMRMFMYFNHLPNEPWKVAEIRTYNGQVSGDWIYYKGFVGSSLGTSLVVQALDLTSDLNNSSNLYAGTIHFENLRLQPFLTQITPQASPTPTLIPTRMPTPTPLATPTPTNKPTLTPVDNTRPTVSITSPKKNSVVLRSKVTVISASAADASGISKVEFVVNGTIKCTDINSPYSCTWAVPASRGGIYSLTAKAYDQKGNSKTSDSVRVIGL